MMFEFHPKGVNIMQIGVPIKFNADSLYLECSHAFVNARANCKCRSHYGRKNGVGKSEKRLFKFVP